MTAQTQSLPSFASIISVLSIVFYCVGFFRVELQLNEQNDRITALESVAEARSPSNNPDVKIIENFPEIQRIRRSRRQTHSTKNATEAKITAEALITNTVSKLLSQLCTPDSNTCSSGPPGLPGPPGPRGRKGTRGRKGQKGDKGIMGSPGKSGKQGIMGPSGLKGETGTEGVKGDVGPTGKPGSKGDRGPTGMPGTKGDRGPTGMTGTKGDKGLTGMPGTKGDRGPTGMPGTKGDRGPTGMTGTKGERGPTGMPGTKGDRGPNGMPGTKGEPGTSMRYRDCSDLLKSGVTQNGVYSVDPDGKGPLSVYCDMRTDGGGWTVFLQRRQDGSVDFYRGWNDYKAGFGQLTAEFWLGNDKIHRLTASRPNSLRVELEDWNGVRVYAKYGKFNIGDEQALYQLEVGSYSGTAGDSLTDPHNNMTFTTKDRDNEKDSGWNCAVAWTSAWWYNRCHESHLNGKYLGSKKSYQGVMWSTFRGTLSLKFTEMKLRPS